jgi:SPP1 family predicted phage head-tail adaptor
MMQSGDLKHRIIILTEQSTKDADGFVKKTWAELYSIWAYVNDISGKAFYQQDAEKQVKTITCTIRYRTDITESMRIAFRDETYRIMRIYQGEYDNHWMCLDCQIIRGVSD